MRLACESARRTPSTSRSVQYTGVPGCCRHDSSRLPASMPSKPSVLRRPMTTALARRSSPATGNAIRPFVPAERPPSAKLCAMMLLKAFRTEGPNTARPSRSRSSRSLDRSDAAVAERWIVVAGIDDDHRLGQRAARARVSWPPFMLAPYGSLTPPMRCVSARVRGRWSHPRAGRPIGLCVEVLAGC